MDIGRRLLLITALAVLPQCAAPSVPTPPSTTLPASSFPAASPTAAAPTSISATRVPEAPVSAVREVTAAELGASWRPGCPVGPDQLRRVELDYLGFDGQIHRGQLIVHRDLVDQTIAIFTELHRLRFPIERMQTPEHYPGAEDELSMRDNNTSAFNCRGIPGSTNWSQHGYGRAIDINPLLNPSISNSGRLEPATAGPYLDRSRIDPGLLHDGDPAVRVFTDRGWTWGGHWRNPKDYQHFELPAG